MLEKIEIDNFLSINEKEVLKVTNRLTTLIGQNAAGKSAILKAIEKLNGKEIKEHEKNINRKREKTIIRAKISINKNDLRKMNEEYKKQYPNGILKISERDDLIYEISVDDDGNLTQKYYYKDEKKGTYVFDMHILDEITKKIKEIIRNIKDQQLIDSLNINTSNVLDYNTIIQELPIEIKEKMPQEDNERILSYIEEYKNNRSFFYPRYQFVYMNSFKDILVDEIFVDEIENNSTVQSFLSIAGVTPEEIRGALDAEDDQTLESLTNKVVDIVTEDYKKINSQITSDEKFKIKMRIDSKNRRLSFLIQNKNTGHGVIRFSEESEGTQWYLSIYLKLYEYLHSNTQNNTNYILLLDEPNIYLHSVAQKDLLENVFNDSLRDIQIIYTTHSPYMINTEDLYSIRIVDKTDQTHIYTNPEDYLRAHNKDKKTNDVDVLSPVLTAMGLSISNHIIPDINEKLIVVEGKEDYYMLNTMINILNLQSKNYRIIPCNGATKVPYMCGYLFGMGYKLIALLDNDSPGRKAISNLKIKDTNDTLVPYTKYGEEKNEGDFLLENMFSKKDQKTYLPEKSTINYRMIYDKKDSIVFEEETMINFCTLFERIDELFNK